jgi:hypothetical protein
MHLVGYVYEGKNSAFLTHVLKSLDLIEQTLEYF